MTDHVRRWQAAEEHPTGSTYDADGRRAQQRPCTLRRDEDRQLLRPDTGLGRLDGNPQKSCAKNDLSVEVAPTSLPAW
jgi:hypothetical protein